MLEFDKALNLILSNVVSLETEKVPLSKAHQRVLAASTHYDVDLPPFNKSAMDGYACRSEDMANTLHVIETISAGKKPEKVIGENQCAKIMTGAVVPEGADTVVMKEYVEELSDASIKCQTSTSKSNICYTGEDVRVGDLALLKNTFITAKHMPILANAGIDQPEVYRQPRVTFFATGSELVEPSEMPASHQIRNSNSTQMMAQLYDLGLEGEYGGIIRDDFEETKSKIAAAFEMSDVVILSGGVSEGDFDFIPSVIKDLGFEILLTRIAVQPGKPIIFARKGNQYCFGLAGNPASSYIQFDLYLKPFLLAMMGYNWQAEMHTAVLTIDVHRKKTDRLKFMPAQLKNGKVTPVEYHGAAHINALIHANSLMVMPLGVAEIKKGETVDVRPF